MMLTHDPSGFETVIDCLPFISIYDFLESSDVLQLLLCNSRFFSWVHHDGALVLPNVTLNGHQQLLQGRLALPLVARVTTVSRLHSLPALLTVFRNGVGPNVTSLAINSPSTKELNLSGLAFVVNCCASLEKLRLVGIKLDEDFNQFLCILHRLSSLRELVISGCGATIDVNIISRRMPDLKRLELVGNAPVESLAGLGALEDLKYFVKGAAVNKEYTRPLQEVFPHLRSLSLDSSRFTTPRMLETLGINDVSLWPVQLEALELKSSCISLAQEDFGASLGRLVSSLPRLKSLSFNWAFVFPGKGNIDSAVEALTTMHTVKDLRVDYHSGASRLGEFIKKFPCLEALELTGPLERLVLEPSLNDEERCNVRRLSVVDTSASSSLQADNLRALLRLCPMVETLTLSRGCGVTPNDVTALSRVCRETLGKLNTVEIRKAKLGMPASGPLLVESIVRLMPSSVRSVTLLYTDISVLGYRSVKALAGPEYHSFVVEREKKSCESPDPPTMSDESTELRERSATVSGDPNVEAVNVSLGSCVELVVRSQTNRSVELCHLDLPRRRTFSWDV